MNTDEHRWETARAVLLLAALLAAACAGPAQDEAVRTAYEAHVAHSALSDRSEGEGSAAGVRPPLPGQPPIPLPPPPPPPDPRLEAARNLFEEGLRAFEVDEWATALDKFNEAYELSPRAAILYNLAVCHERLGDVASAIGAYQRYLGEDPDMVDERRQEVLDKIRELGEQLEVQP
ncbi:MAG: tetratricopeptide repeat protein [Deltaproteobacteria bacterium]|nr:tetratricopeptide repeat protein [Deltaproteobacteria bacterium]